MKTEQSSKMSRLSCRMYHLERKKATFRGFTQGQNKQLMFLILYLKLGLNNSVM